MLPQPIAQAGFTYFLDGRYPTPISVTTVTSRAGDDAVAWIRQGVPQQGGQKVMSRQDCSGLASQKCDA